MKKGFTIIEILVVIAILLIIGAISMVALSNFNRHQSIEKDTETIVETLRQARIQALSSKDASAYGVHFASTSVILFSGSSYSAGNTNNIVYEYRTPNLVVAPNLYGSSISIVFKRLTGETDYYGTVAISSPTATTTKTITIYKTGIIQYK